MTIVLENLSLLNSYREDYSKTEKLVTFFYEQVQHAIELNKNDDAEKFTGLYLSAIQDCEFILKQVLIVAEDLK